MNITLTDDQQNAVNALTSFLATDNAPAFVLEGYAGTGKSTLVSYILDNIQKILKTIKIMDPKYPDYQIELTATTNKAAENLTQMTGIGVRTIHSFLGLRVSTDYKTRETKLVRTKFTKMENILLFIDEASYIDRDLLEIIHDSLDKCKIIFIGDPAQLIPVKSKNAPVFFAGYPKASLTKVMRQAEGNPIIQLATQFRETVSTLKWTNFTPDNKHVVYLDRESFDNEVVKEFTRPTWSSKSSKILAWTNKKVQQYNQGLTKLMNGKTTFDVGDYAQCNSFYQAAKTSIKTDELVLITAVSEPVVLHGVTGHYYTMNGTIKAFCPDHILDKKALLSKARKEEQYALLHEIEEVWIDLRTVYACTINKSQGSTYDRVFVDLDDIKKCNSGEAMARLLYVGCSRPRHQLILTGDLV
jgi:exodeoxyribonuclease V